MTEGVADRSPEERGKTPVEWQMQRPQAPGPAGPIEALFATIVDFHRRGAHRHDHPMVERVIEALDQARPALPAPAPLPVCRHLDAVEPRTGDRLVDAVLEAFLTAAPLLPWRRTAGYLDVLPAAYLDNYGYVQLVGPGSLAEHTDVRVGIGLWGPDLFYPAHHHPAEELYHVLAGRPTFIHGDVEVDGVAGDTVHHLPWQPHAQRFGNQPTVLLYSWTGDVVPDAELIDHATQRRVASPPDRSP